MTTRATLTIEIEVEISGEWVRAEPEVGILYPYFEITGFDHKSIDWQKVEAQYSEEIQQALADERQGEREDAADYRYDEARDSRGDA